MSLDHDWSRVELALGTPLGVVPEALVLPSCALSPRAELERIIDDQFASGRQVFVCFSGGRDSSAVLALAVHVARRNGAPLPIPVTLRFPDHPESDETNWQEMVVRHLDLTEWIVIDRPDADLLDRQRHLRQGQDQADHPAAGTALPAPSQAQSWRTGPGTGRGVARAGNVDHEDLRAAGRPGVRPPPVGARPAAVPPPPVAAARP